MRRKAAVLLSTLMLAYVLYIPTISAAPDEDVILSKVDALSEYQAGLNFPVSYTVISAGSGLEYVELYYREEGHYSFSKYAPSSNPDGTWTTYPIPFSAPDDGTYEFYCRAFDTSRHSEGRKRTAEAVTTVDSKIPQTSVDLEGKIGLGGWYLGPVTVFFSAEDEGSGVERTEYRVDQGDWIEAQGWKAILSSNGAHTLMYRSFDRAGNEETSSSLSINIDMTSPGAVFGVSNGTQFGGRATIGWNIVGAGSGLVSIEMSLDGGDFEKLPLTTRSVTLSDLAEGDHYLIIRSQDAAGGFSDSRLNFQIDFQIDPEGNPLIFLGMVVLTFAAVMTAISLGSKRNRGQNSRP